MGGSCFFFSGRHIGMVAGCCKSHRGGCRTYPDRAAECAGHGRTLQYSRLPERPGMSARLTSASDDSANMPYNCCENRGGLIAPGRGMGAVVALRAAPSSASGVSRCPNFLGLASSFGSPTASSAMSGSDDETIPISLVSATNNCLITRTKITQQRPDVGDLTPDERLLAQFTEIDTGRNSSFNVGGLGSRHRIR